MDRIPTTPRKPSEFNKAKLRKTAARKWGDGDSESEAAMTVDDFSIHPSGAKLSKNPHVVAQRERWSDYQKSLNGEQEDNREESKRAGFGRLCKVAATVACSVLAAVCFLYLPVFIEQLMIQNSSEISPAGSGSITITWEEGQEQFKRSVKVMMRKYPNQMRESWIQILSSVTSTMTVDSPRQPSSIVVLTPPEIDSGFAPCLAREIGRNAHSVFYNVTKSQFTRNILELDSDDFNNAQSVTEIHDKLLTYLKNGKVVIIKNAHLITEEDRLLILHAFCDNSAAPDNRATFLFILPAPPRIYGNKSSVMS
ncbi:unnamed protein product [Allacma fusca]|uniref:Uncharacterized protein n=1 Tax=Allacma fusca TaxID=39272 RepID=A0A8J2LT48_9HEXA|nr:unnamed protein product [Allacma fusca]